MKNKKLIIIVLALVIVVISGIGIYKHFKSEHGKEKNDKTAIYTNFDKFAMEVNDDSVSEIGKAYLKYADFEIIEWDVESMKGVIKLRVPDSYDVMLKTVEEFNHEYSSNEDDSIDLESVLKERLISAIENTDQIREKEFSVELIEYENEIRIVPSKEVFNYIYDDFLRISIEMQAGTLGGENNVKN